MERPGQRLASIMGEMIGIVLDLGDDPTDEERAEALAKIDALKEPMEHATGGVLCGEGPNGEYYEPDEAPSD